MLFSLFEGCSSARDLSESVDVMPPGHGWRSYPEVPGENRAITEHWSYLFKLPCFYPAEFLSHLLISLHKKFVFGNDAVLQ